MLPSTLLDEIPAMYICTIDENDKSLSLIQKEKIIKRHNQMKEIITLLPQNKIHWNKVPRMHKGTQQLSSTDNHLLAYRDAYKRGYSHVLVVEDDLYTNKDVDINKCVSELNKQLHFFNWRNGKQILYLGHLAWKMDPHAKEYSIVKFLGQCIHAYIINREMIYDLISYNCEDIIRISSEHWKRKPCGYALDTFIAIGVNDYSFISQKIHGKFYNEKNKDKENYKSYAFYPQFIMQDSIPNYDGWSKVYEEVCWYFGSIQNFYIFFAIVIILFKKSSTPIIKYSLFGCISWCTSLFSRMMKY